MSGPLVFLLQALVYFAVMATLFHMRRRLGLGVFVCALGVMHFLETYLASLFVHLPFGLISSSSPVLFSGKLAMILLLYMREDAEAVRQPVYGLLIGNCLVVLLAFMLRLEAPAIVGHALHFGLIDQIGGLMLWGTLLLFIDSIALILLHERLNSLSAHVGLRAFISLASVLTFDQVGFYLGLQYMTPTPPSALLGGWIVKIVASAVYAGLLSAYLHFMEDHPIGPHAHNLKDVFSKLTYRHRYQELLRQASVDPLTGALNRGQFETLGTAMLDRAWESPYPVSLAIIDIDHFKAINDVHGHVTGDAVLKHLVATLKQLIRSEDKLFRYGGEEFVLLCEDMHHAAAIAHAERLRLAIPVSLGAELGVSPTISIGVATYPEDARSLIDLVRRADIHLYEAKSEGRNRVVGKHDRQPTPIA